MMMLTNTLGRKTMDKLFKELQEEIKFLIEERRTASAGQQVQINSELDRLYNAKACLLKRGV